MKVPLIYQTSTHIMQTHMCMHAYTHTHTRTHTGVWWSWVGSCMQ